MADEELPGELPVELTVEQGALYMLEWTVPDTTVTNAFVNPDGSAHEFPDPDPPEQGQTPARIEITLRKGPDESTLEPEGFRKNRTPPFVAKTTVKTDAGEERKAKVFRATFKAREQGVYSFKVTVGASGRSKTQTMTVTAPTRKVYRTIEEVMKDPAAVRRRAVLASVADFFPAFNTDTNPNVGTQGERVGHESGVMGQGLWVKAYSYPPSTLGTSCTTVNPMIMRKREHGGEAGNNTIRWAFNAGPVHPPGSPGWIPCDKDHIPSVGDTYIVLNPWTAKEYGHVGIVLHVPESGNGLWVTADGGQAGKPRQYAILVPRWGLMGAMLPLQGMPQGSYPEMVPEPSGGPFLSGATLGDLHKDAPVPQVDDDVQGIIGRIRFRPSKPGAAVSCPRRMEGYVDIDHPKLTFDVDTQPPKSDHMAKCAVLQKKVADVIAACRSGGIIGGTGT